MEARQKPTSVGKGSLSRLSVLKNAFCVDAIKAMAKADADGRLNPMQPCHACGGA
jgi:hypothetical protein